MTWIEISEKLPEPYEEILFLVGGEEIHFGHLQGLVTHKDCEFYSFNEKKGYKYDLQIEFDERVTKWLQIPPIK